jgi:hypothetical protein
MDTAVLNFERISTLQEIKINKLVGDGNTLPSVGQTPTNTPAGAYDSNSGDMEISPGPTDLKLGSGDLVFAVVKQIEDDSTPGMCNLVMLDINLDAGWCCQFPTPLWVGNLGCDSMFLPCCPQ